MEYRVPADWMVYSTLMREVVICMVLLPDLADLADLQAIYMATDDGIYSGNRVKVRSWRLSSVCSRPHIALHVMRWNSGLFGLVRGPEEVCGRYRVCPKQYSVPIQCKQVVSPC